MMEKQTSGAENAQFPPQSPTKLPMEKVFGFSSSQFAEYDASKLVGSIVEKSVSAIPPSSAPRPSVLPFPVAHHRSHATHWVPKIGECSHSDDNVEEDFEHIDNDTTDYDPIAKFAKSVKKEKRKGLDLTNWRDLVPSNDASKAHRKEVQKKKGNGEVVEAAYEERISIDMKPDKEVGAESLIDTSGGTCVIRRDNNFGSSVFISGPSGSNTRNGAGSGERSHTDADVVSKSLRSIEGPTMLEKEFSTSFSSGIGPEEDFMSLKAQIDAENQALLQRMSPDEVSEAQEEIKDKINPKLLQVLKNRGRRKSEKQTSSDAGSFTGDRSGFADMQVDKPLIQDGNSSSTLGHKFPAALPTMQKTQKGEALWNSYPSSSMLWDAWSKRVEAARDIRFSLEGDIVEIEFPYSYGNSTTLYGAVNATERDPLRTEGDPAAGGYTINEALALARSVVPGQRAIALHLLACVFRKALHGICQNQFRCTLRNAKNMKSLVDWEAIWAYALGPEPELALSLRMLLDDNHEFVVLASAKVIQCILGSDVNEKYSDVSQKMAVNMMDLYTAPVFRSRPKINVGCLRGGFWKYSAKPSNIIPFSDDKTEEEQTIKDDIAVASQDIVAGLVRMETLSRLYYLLKMQSTLALDECILSILIAISRHSPTCASAILKCHGLVQIVVDKFASGDKLEMMTFKIKSVTLVRVLAQSSRRDCFEFTKNGIFLKMTWHLLRVTYSIDEWTKSGKEHVKLAAELMIEQLRFLKVCISYGYCISSFFFPALCLWLDPPSYEKLIEKNILLEYTSVSKEVYLILEVLSRRLPSLYLEYTKNQFPDACDSAETWCWKDVAPMVDLGLKWVAVNSNSPLSRFLDKQGGIQCKSVEENRYLSSLLWVTSAIIHMLSTVIVKATPDDRSDLCDCGEIGQNLPELVTKIGLQIIRSDFLCFNAARPAECPKGTYEAISFVEKLCSLRHHTDFEISLASVHCLHGVICLIVSVDHLFQMAKSLTEHSTRQDKCLSGEAKILDRGIVNSSLGEWRVVLFEFMSLVVPEWRLIQNVEVFGRGGPAPGVGLGWGLSGGGFWSSAVALAQADATLLVSLLEMFQTWHAKDLSGTEDKICSMQMINSSLTVCLIAGPKDRMIVEKAWAILLQLPVLRFLNQCIQNWLHHTQGGKVFQWQYGQNDLVHFGNILASHFSKRWLAPKKKKSKAKDGTDSSGFRVSKGSKPLETIHEDVDSLAITREDHTALAVEWAHQRLPLPDHWFLSPITSIADVKCEDLLAISGRVDSGEDLVEFLQVARAGLFFLFGIEAMTSNLSEKDDNPVMAVSLVWKLHSLSVVLLGGMGILEEDRSKDVYEALQNLYGLRLNELKSNKNSSTAQSLSQIKSGEYWNPKNNLLAFQSEIHESYSTFIETLVEQFAAVSYGDFAYGRQMAIYLHQEVDVPVRHAAWTALSNARVLDLLPPLDECIAEAEGYLEPVEEHEGILEAYVKSWVTGALDRAATRGSIAYAIVLHHLSSFIFRSSCGEKLPLRSKLVKLLLRDYNHRQQREGMMLDLVRYKSSSKVQRADQSDLPLQTDELNRKFELLRDACGAISPLLNEVEKLKSSSASS